ncbi:hypothetical protein GPL15_25475 [Clostridium sp. MCC353]|uniref:hypothetical protein n=1 Tax=Clostridium sp. MCC353 TaxID=2592646 RepID=UPI001C033090|nr:hypothetical protein [Clostridium sp. MCC353]MBT9779826.1 hypothetical protein [Clostridium sp. MCC353]
MNYYTENELQETFNFRNASDSEDAVIQQFLITIQDLPAKDNKLDFFFKKAAPIIVIAVFIFSIYSGITTGFNTGLILLPVMLAAIYGVQMFQVYKQKWTSSGIKHNFTKHGNHFYLASAVCNEKTVKRSALGRRIFLIKGKISGGQTIDEIPVIKTHYDMLQNGSHFNIVAARQENGYHLFALPQSIFPANLPHSNLKKADSGTSKQKRRRMDSNDCALVRKMQKERIHIRRHLYLRNQMIILACLAAFFLYQLVMVNSAGITLGLFMLLAYSVTFLSNFIHDHGIMKALKNYGALFCADASVSVIRDGNSSFVEFRDNSGKILFTSSLKDDIYWFQTGEKALLVYFDEQTPVAYKII